MLIFRQVKHHLALGNKFHCVFVKFDKTSGKITTVSKRQAMFVQTFTFLQFLVITAKIWSVVTKSVTSLSEKILGTAIASLTIVTFLIRCNTFPDYVQAQFLNYIFFTKGYPCKKFLKIMRHLRQPS